MKLVVLGASGGTGKLRVEQTLAAGHDIVALVRNPAKLAARHERLTIISGDVTDPAAVERLVVAYPDGGGDAFELQYDALSGGPFGDGRFRGTGLSRKASTGLWKTAVSKLCDAHFASRDQGADLRIFDQGDGPETIQRVALTLLSPTPCP
jgi:hypothetical protein